MPTRATVGHPTRMRDGRALHAAGGWRGGDPPFSPMYIDTTSTTRIYSRLLLGVIVYIDATIETGFMISHSMRRVRHGGVALRLCPRERRHRTLSHSYSTSLSAAHTCYIGTHSRVLVRQLQPLLVWFFAPFSPRCEGFSGQCRCTQLHTLACSSARKSKSWEILSVN